MSLYAERPWLQRYGAVPADLPVPSTTVLDAMEERARVDPAAPAIHYFDTTLSFGCLDEYANRMAALLASWEIGKGDRVALSLQNNPQFAIAQFGAWKRGAIVVPLSPMFKEKELHYHLEDSGARAWIGLESLYTSDARTPLAAAGVEHVLVTHEMEMCGGTSGPLLTELARHEPATAHRVSVGPDDIAYLVYTSGTTGPPKGAMNLHRNVAFNAEVYRRWMDLSHEDGVLGLAPLFHITGLVAQLAVTAWTGAPLILFHRFDAAEALRLCRKWRATYSLAAITAYIALMNEPGEGGFLSKCYSGGAPVAPGLAARFEQRFGTYIHNIYGLTESTSPSHAVPMGTRAPVDPASGALSIGVPVPNCEARVLDLVDPSKEVPPGEPGELALRGPMIFAGYWNKPEETARAFLDGFFRTGDIAVMDHAGWFYLVDRKKDMIIVSGFKVWPREVEDTLYQHPAVREAAVVGVADEYRGETIRAFVARKDDCTVTEDELIRFCRERIAAYKCPRSVRFLDELPKTATGKFLRRRLREF